jgi:hypothetical protein
MSTVNPILKAAAPTLIAAIGDLKAAINTIVTGDPAMIAARVGPAVGIFVNQLALLLPGLEVSELGAVGTDVNAKLDNIVAKLQALAA